MTREEILNEAMKCVCGQREQDYGTPESNFQLIADLWNAYLKLNDHEYGYLEAPINARREFVKKDISISATDVAMMMSLMKIARIKNGGGTGDSFVDLAGYAACGGEINSSVSKEEKKSGRYPWSDAANCLRCKHHNPEEYNPFCDSCDLGDKWEPKTYE